jgi:hypothetical protein
VDGAVSPSSAKDKVVAAMARLDRLAAELDDAVARLDARAPAAAQGEQPLHPRARWYWTAPASAAPPVPSAPTDEGALAEASGPP